MYEAIAFFDLDGTLLNGKSQVSAEVGEAITQLKKNKVLPIIATGRNEQEIQQIKQDAHITSTITMNGMIVKVDGTIIEASEIAPEQCESMLHFARNLQDELAFHSTEQLFISGVNEFVKKSYEFFHLELPPIHPQAYQEFPTNMILVLSEGNDTIYQEAYPEFTFYRNGPFCIDVVNKGISKGTGVQTVKDYLKLPDIPTFGFGDGINDVALLMACDNKIAMSNALPEVKEQSDYVTAKNTNGGIIKALKHYDLI
ncbi:Cof-type HAD-IIB family hydrolase [Enterococcus sp. AZ109]|uniref:Cof-type HAD-IIB family hydrolase n=1 Tax=Enterococcus sp. AZ109 TaxID=2774634 RepID=UPI003F276FE9